MVTVSVIAVGGTNEQQNLNFEITDSGIGIAAAHLATIFESYTQADNTVTRRFGGTGLGLAITRQLVEHMGGKIRVESELDKGSCFSFELSFQINTVDDKDTANAFDFEAQQVFVLTPNIDKLPNIKAALMGWGVKFASDPSVDVLVEKLSLDLASGGARSVIMLDTKLPDVAIAVQRIRDETGDREPVFLYVADQGIASAVELPIPLAELESSVDETLLFRALRLAGTFVGCAESLDGDDDRLDGRSTARNLSVLLVEDNSVNRKVITKIISRAGHRVVTVIDGDAALDVLDTQKFDVVLMDVNIPGLSGPETTKHYRFAHMGEDYVPIIALTADATLETRQQCIDAGMDTVVTKPVEARTLIDVVETFALRYGAQSTPDKDSTVGKVVRSPKPSAARSNASAGSGAASVSRPPLRVVTDSPINPKAIENLRELGDVEFVESVISDFLINAEAIMQSLHQAVDTGQLNSLREHAHALRSSSAHVGAMRMHVVAKEINDMNQADLDANGRAMVQALDAEFAVLREALEEELASLTAVSTSS